MKRKMTLLARGMKCGGRAASDSEASVAPRACSPSNSEPSAIAPMPTRHCWKKCRRAASSGVFGARSAASVTESLAGNGLVEIQKHAANARPSNIAIIECGGILTSDKMLKHLTFEGPCLPGDAQPTCQMSPLK